MKPTENKTDALRRKYKALHSTRKQFEDDIRTYVEALVRGHEEMFVTSRTKTEDSFIAKATNKDKKYKDPFTQITDITGIRIIVQYKDDAVNIGEILRERLQYDHKNSRDTRDEASTSSFGYSAIHIVASLPEEAIRKHGWEAIEGHKFEIQIRTNLEHAWASKSRELSYNKSIKDKYERELNRLAAIIELTDVEFMRLRDEVSITSLHTANKPAQLKMDIDTATIMDILTKSTTIKNIVSKLASQGLKADESVRAEYAGYILDIFARQGATTKDQVEKALQDNEDKIVNACAMYMNPGNNKSFLKDSLLVAALAIVNNGDMTPEAYSETWNASSKNNFRKAAREFEEKYGKDK